MCSFEPPRTKHRVINLLLSTARPCSKGFVRPQDAKLAEPSPSMQMLRPQRSECSISHINSHFFSRIHRRPSQVLLKGFSRSPNYASGKKKAEKNVRKSEKICLKANFYSRRCGFCCAPPSTPQCCVFKCAAEKFPHLLDLLMHDIHPSLPDSPFKAVPGLA